MIDYEREFKSALEFLEFKRQFYRVGDQGYGTDILTDLIDRLKIVSKIKMNDPNSPSHEKNKDYWESIFKFIESKRS